MGSACMAIGARAADLASIFASRDDARYRALLDSSDDFVRSLLELDDEHSDRRTALCDLFVGAACDEVRPHHYGFAMEAVCFQFGERLGEVGGASFFLTDARDVLVGAGGSSASLPTLSEQWFVPIPPMEDWPLVAVVPAADCQRHANTLMQALPHLPADTDSVSREVLQMFTRWYLVCASRGIDLILISH